ncbi:anthranilate synthase component I family protein [Streptomyces sp. NPDC047117]|uniref:anthranilate synthase component I family protein n=1 Tax=unclassified Streptomyces TaxID=2593676 RepID=UPI0033F390F9
MATTTRAGTAAPRGTGTVSAPARPAAAGTAPAGRVAVRVVSEELPAHDPLRLYAELSARLGSQDAFLFESLAGPDKDRRSAVVGYGRLAEIRVHHGRVEIEGPDALRAALLGAADAAGMRADEQGRRPGTEVRLFRGSGQVWDLMRRARALFSVETEVPDDAYAFGFLSCLAYESAWHMDTLPERDAERGGPDMTFTLFRDTVWYDLETRRPRHLAADAPEFPDRPAQDTYALAEAAARVPAGPGHACPPAPAPRSVRDSVARGTFLGWARRCLEHIRIGDIYQIQIGHRIDVESALTPLDVYRRLRSRNPSPYMYLAPRAGDTLIGASPELFFRTQGGTLAMRPIAGTTPRATTDEENERRIKEMLASTKERAEHVMLVDLCRNDVGRVCRPGTLAAEDLMTVEAYSHVFHIVSTVTGELEPDADVWRSLCATFPAGTMTGAPKLRAMEIIDGIEEEPRGIYAGAVGLIDTRGWSELALCIRTIVHDGRTYSTQSSAGIVAESDPESEWNETLAKMGAAHWALTGEELLS